MLLGNEQILINVKTAISHLPARFFILILFVPHNTGNENLLHSRRPCISKSSANRQAASSPQSLSPTLFLVNRGKLQRAKEEDIARLTILQLDLSLGFLGPPSFSVLLRLSWGEWKPEGLEAQLTSVLLKGPDFLLGGKACIYSLSLGSILGPGACIDSEQDLIKG